jgi:hypothetical protein
LLSISNQLIFDETFKATIMNRYNIFYQVHKGLRAMLYETAILLQQTDFSDAADTAQVLQEMDEVATLFDKHAGTEDHHILGALEPLEPSVSTLFEEEHVLDHQLSFRLRLLSSAIRQSSSVEEKVSTGNRLVLAFEEFMIFNLEHMRKEETDLNCIIWQYFTDDQLHAITMRIVSSIPADLENVFNRRMIRGLNDTEIINWLKLMKDKAPYAAVENLLQIAERELDLHRFIAINEAVTEEAKRA